MACDCRGTSLKIPDDLTPKNGCVVVNTVAEDRPGCQHELNENELLRMDSLMELQKKNKASAPLLGFFNLLGRNI